MIHNRPQPPIRPVSLSAFDIPGMDDLDRPEQPQADVETEEDLLFRHMFMSGFRHPMPRPLRPSPAARFSVNNTPFRG
jgi:hypothetical protein